MKKINVIDVGSVGGPDIHWKNHLNKVGHTLSFEPNELPILEGKDLRYDCAIWNFNGQSKFYISGPNGVGSSLLEQNFDWVQENFDRIRFEGNPKFNNTWFERSRILKEVPCQVKTLDTVLAEINQVHPSLSYHFLKSDTQSGESFVLEGAKQFLTHECIGLDLELFRYPLYKNLITEDVVKDYLSSLGFSIAGWTGYINSFHCSADYLFLRNEPRNAEEDQLIQQIKTIYNPKGPQRFIKKLSILQRLNYKARAVARRLVS
jgi:hypothetical protein